MRSKMATAMPSDLLNTDLTSVFHQSIMLCNTIFSFVSCLYPYTNTHPSIINNDQLSIYLSIKINVIVCVVLKLSVNLPSQWLCGASRWASSRCWTTGCTTIRTGHAAIRNCNKHKIHNNYSSRTTETLEGVVIHNAVYHSCKTE